MGNANGLERGGNTASISVRKTLRRNGSVENADLMDMP
jgi:hypothetical protein